MSTLRCANRNADSVVGVVLAEPLVPYRDDATEVRLFGISQQRRGVCDVPSPPLVPSRLSHSFILLWLWLWLWLCEVGTLSDG